MKILYLDGVRGVAALFVIFCHFFAAFLPAIDTGEVESAVFGWELIVSTSPLNIPFNGNLSVLIFFVLSGFVLPWKFFQTNSIDYIYSGLVKRFVRLYIPIFFSLLFSYVFYYFGFLNSKGVGFDYFFPSLWRGDITLFTVLRDSTWGAFIQGASDLNMVLWTMHYEFFGSIIIYILVFMSRRNKYKNLMYLALASFLLFFDSYYASFLFGLFLVGCSSNGTLISSKKLSGLAFLFFILFGGYPTNIVPSNGFYKDLVYFLGFNVEISHYLFFHTLAAFFLIYSALTSKVIQDFMSRSFFQFLGRLSFSVYLVHLLFLGSITKWVYINCLELGVVFSLILSFSVYIISTYLFALFFMLRIDEISIVLSGRFYKLVNRFFYSFRRLFRG